MRAHTNIDTPARFSNCCEKQCIHMLEFFTQVFKRWGLSALTVKKQSLCLPCYRSLTALKTTQLVRAVWKLKVGSEVQNALPRTPPASKCTSAIIMSLMTWWLQTSREGSDLSLKQPSPLNILLIHKQISPLEKHTKLHTCQQREWNNGCLEKQCCLLFSVFSWLVRCCCPLVTFPLTEAERQSSLLL